MVTQQLQAAIDILGAEGDSHMAVVTLLQAHGFTAEVGLVTDQRDVARVRALIEELRPEGEGIAGFGCRGVDHQQYPIGFANGLERPLDTYLFHMVIGITQACGVHHV
ncbi:hypothetical protein D3C78_1735770 [compost metagenome]